jgi:hypothetical protein
MIGCASSPTASIGLALRLKPNRRRIHTIPQPRRPRAIREDVSQMRTTFVANDLLADHYVGRVGRRVDHLFVRRVKEAGPAAARIELFFRREKRLAAADAAIHALLMMVPIFAAKRGLRPFLSRHMKLFRR